MNLTEADKALKAHPTRVKAVYATGNGTRARGVLVGYSDAPSGILRLPDGTNEHWRLDLIHLDDEPEPETFAPHKPTADDWRDAANALEQENATLTDRLACPTCSTKEPL